MNAKQIANELLLFKCMAGSHAYGTSLPTSDQDTRGVCVAPPELVLSCVQGFDQYEDKTTDTVIYELKKFFKLAADCNPNIIELLYTDECNILFMHPLFQMVRDKAFLFLSKKAKHTFSGYAMSQMQRIKGHHKWICNPQPEQPPLLASYCTYVNSSGVITRGLDDSPVGGAATIRLLAKGLFLVQTFGHTIFRVYRDLKGEFCPGFFNEDETDLRYIDIEESRLARHSIEFLGMLIVNFDEFRKARTTWKDYWTWKRERNEARAELEAKYGFDCYSADTEFLTEGGWKQFDSIGPDTKLATINQQTRRVEYQKYVERHDSKYTGNMYLVSGYHTDIRVSGNHRMFVRPFSRKLGQPYEWQFIQACKLPDCFEIVNRIRPNTRQLKNDTPCGLPLVYYLRLIGWYVSEGSVAKRLANGSPSVLSLSQLKGGRLHWHVSRAIPGLAKFGVKINEYSHYRESKDREEMIWTIPHREIAARLVDECGDRSQNKRLPRWVMYLSSRMQRVLLNALHCGDGTDRVSRGEINRNAVSKYNSRRVYYSCSNQLADDVNELAFLAGLESSKWGPYEGGMYQVHINASADKFRKLIRHQNIKIDSVYEERIVCFTVPNEILITRRNGNIAVQGNTKHASHLVRLMRMAQEILTEGKVVVRRPDAQELLDIRFGKFDYDWLMKWSADTDAALNDLYEKSSLQNSADWAKIDELYREVLHAFWREKGLA